jgi:hypothetical protein
MTPDEVLDSIALTANYPATMALKPIATLRIAFMSQGKLPCVMASW